MFLLSGVARYLFVPLAESVVFAVMASYFFSRTLVPTLAMYLLKDEHDERQVTRPTSKPNDRHDDDARDHDADEAAHQSTRRSSPSTARTASSADGACTSPRSTPTRRSIEQAQRSRQAAIAEAASSRTQHTATGSSQEARRRSRGFFGRFQHRFEQRLRAPARRLPPPARPRAATITGSSPSSSSRSASAACR